MTASTVLLTPSVNNLTNFKAYGQGISKLITDVGFIKTTDTGQIDWNTVTQPATNTFGGYEIFRFNDVHQTTCPIFFKIMYGQGGNAGAPMLDLTVSGATDGAGNLSSLPNTGISLRTFRITALASSNVGSSYCYGWSDGSALGVLLNPQHGESAFGGIFFGIERMRNLDGSANADGWALVHAASTSTNGSCGILTSWNHSIAPQPSTRNNYYYAGIPGNHETSILNTTIYPSPIVIGGIPRPYAPSQMLLGVGRTDLQAHNRQTINHYGIARSWIPFGTGYTTGGLSPWGSVSITGGGSLLMRHD